MSHYETFEHYHSTFYKHVEALSVTPFSAGATARGLAALLVAMVRQPGSAFNSNDKAMLMATQRGHQYVTAAVEAITRRAELIAGVDAAEDVRQQLKRKMDLWQKRAQRTAQGNQLGYETKKDGVTVGLRDHYECGCKTPHGLNMRMEPMLQGASNSWFGITLTALAIPQASGKLKQLVEDHWTVLEKVQSEQNIELLQTVTTQLRDLSEYTAAEIWQAVQAKKTTPPDEGGDPSDLKTPEWEVFTDPASAEKGRDFQLRVVPPPKRYAKYFEKVVLAERLREVRALVGFSRIESPSDYDNPTAFPENQRARLSRTQPTWVPASEIRGEGLFFHFKEDPIQMWVKKNKALDGVFLEAHRRWRVARKLEPPDEFYPGLRFVLLHTFAHALIRQLSVECGYTTASLRERIYSRNPGVDEPEMAGVLIYTAAPDSEGTLGGLVSLGRPGTLERHLDQALDNVRLCASDPLCAEHHPYRDGTTLHAASCHACLFAPETSCERGNKYLDRAVLVPTVETGEQSELAFFR